LKYLTLCLLYMRDFIDMEPWWTTNPARHQPPDQCLVLI